uniref:Uncharacterized protein n=1 Tax=Phlebia radiata TaxID=5308 RepID=L8B9D6_PHLRA|nr:hypothetical protein PRA_mt0170 [Phlebia radiata]CCE89237.1 hypothetical protein PRA_mt0170 [Phlebia radiata]
MIQSSAYRTYISFFMPELINLLGLFLISTASCLTLFMSPTLLALVICHCSCLTTGCRLLLLGWSNSDLRFSTNSSSWWR